MGPVAEMLLEPAAEEDIDKSAVVCHLQRRVNVNFESK
jgi:hypothetical protein